MSTVKISQLPALPSISANTSNTLFLGVDIPTAITGKFTATVLAQQLFANNTLNVGSNQQNLPNTIAQFALSGESYVQTNLVNTNGGGTADIVITANNGTDSTLFADFGYANKYYQPGLEFNNIGNAVSPLDGYLYIQRDTTTTQGGNLIVGTTSSNTAIKLIVGGGSSSNIVGKITANSFITYNPIIFADGTTQNTASASNAYSQAAFSLANTALQNTSIITVNNNLNVPNLLSVNAAANIMGTLNVSGMVQMNSVVLLTNSTFSATQAALTVSATPTVALASQDGYLIHASGKQNVSCRIVSDSFGANANTYPLFAGRAARGNVTNPTAVQTNDILLRIGGNGYGTTGYASLGSAHIDFVAAENWTDSARGSQIKFYNSPIGSNVLNQIASFDANTVTFSGSVSPTKGFIYTPFTYPGAQTAITIDFANNSVIRANISAPLTVSFVNYTAGKVVELWITNTSGPNQNFTHGCSALNSTTNSTTYAIPGTSTVVAKYISFDGDLANTLVSVVHA